MKRRSVIIALGAFCLGAMSARLLSRLQRTESTVVVTVNGQPLTQSDLQIALSAYRRTAIEEMVGQSLVLQAAQKKGVVIEPESKIITPPGLFPDESQASARRLRSDRARRALILAGIPESEKRELWATFDADLRDYSLVAIGLKDYDEAAAFQRELKAGAEFESLVSKYSVHLGLADSNNRMSNVSLAQVKYRLGPYVAQSLQSLKPGQMSQPTPSPLGLVVVKVLAVEEAKERLDDLLVDSECLAVDYQLANDALVTSPYVPEIAVKLKIKSSQVGQLPDLVPRQSHPRVLPKPRPILKSGPLIGESPRATDMPTLRKKPADTPGLPMGPIKATIHTASYRLLPDQLQGQGVLRLDLNGNHHADDDEPVLVKVSSAGWKPVSQLAQSVDRFTLEQDLGYWTDRQLSHRRSLLWWHEIVDRPRNGRAEADEVRLRKLGPLEHNSYDLGAEIVRDDQGRLFHYEQRADYSSRTSVDQDDVQRLTDYRDADANWKVSRP